MTYNQYARERDDLQKKIMESIVNYLVKPTRIMQERVEELMRQRTALEYKWLTALGLDPSVLRKK